MNTQSLDKPRTLLDRSYSGTQWEISRRKTELKEKDGEAMHQTVVTGIISGV